MTYESWGGDFSNFAYSSQRWFERGGKAHDGSHAGLFYSISGSGGSSNSVGFRSVLLAAP